MNKIHFMLPAIIAALLLPGLALADSLFVDISTGTYLYNADTSAVRGLMQFDLPTELDSAEIVFAELTFLVSCVIPDSSALAIYCHPLLIAWSPDDISWADLGDSLGLDIIYPEGTLFATSAQGNQTAYFDITAIVKSWQDSSLTNNGLIFFYDNTALPYPVYDPEANPFGQVRFIFSQGQAD